MTARINVAPAGCWQSPITASSLAKASLRLGQPKVHGKDTFWLEGRPKEQGRSVLVRCDADGNCTDLNAAPFDIRSRVHEYGGGAYTLHEDHVYFVNAKDQGIYRLPINSGGRGKAKCIYAHDNLRFADLLVDETRERIIAVAERHHGDDEQHAEPQNMLCGVSLQDETCKVIEQGSDFYSSPSLSPCGNKFAFLSWNHPDMPWDATRLHVGAYHEATGAFDTRIVREGESIFQPTFGPDGRLYFASDCDNWWNLYAIDDDYNVTQITQEQAEFGMPQWVFDMSTFGFVNARTIVSARTANGEWDLCKIDVIDKTCQQITHWPYTSIENFSASQDGCVALCSGATQESCIVRFNSEEQSLKKLQSASSVKIPSDYISVAQSIAFPSANNEQAYGFYYPPCNPEYHLPDGQLPPLIVNVHGGPTTANPAGLNPRFQFWTSRGFAILDVNYRGSTGYGRDYRQKLKGLWGVADVQDCEHGVRHLVEQQKVDGRRVFIMGSSAGGYTVLAALAFTNTFNAGISLYGIGDLEILVHDTHKFEARYTDSLVGPFDKALYHRRSPLYHADQIKAPTLFFQGTEDKVVPPNQAEQMVAALKQNGVPTAYVSMEGEGHGFRRSDSIETLLNNSLEFLCRVMGEKLPDPPPKLTIYNDKNL